MSLPPDYWHDAARALAKADSAMGKLISACQGEHLQNLDDPFSTLSRSIVSQQISVKAADSIWARVQALVGEMTPLQILSAEDDALRACGLSRQKILYMKNIAEAYTQGVIDLERWQNAEDEEVIRDLTSIKGIGKWTAEMFLIFGLQRPDVFPLGDVGLVKAIERHYADGQKLSRDDLHVISTPWRPWRTVATWYLWRSLDPVAVQY